MKYLSGASKMRRMKLSLDAGVFRVPLAREYRDLHVVAGVLKSYLRELPEPLLTHSLHSAFVAAARLPNENDRLRALWDAVQLLPPHNKRNLRYLLKFLAALTRNRARNKMTAANLAIVIAPNLLWARDEVDMNAVAAITASVEALIAHADWFFKEDVNFFITFTKDDLFPDDYGFAPNFGPGYNQTAALAPENSNGEHNSMSRSSYDGRSDEPPGRHSRSNSHDTSLILLDNSMRKAQSNSSLSDQSSPPHGSPKPVTRRKNKPLAPVPPIFSDKNKNTESTTEIAPRSESDKPAKPPRPVISETGKVITGVQTINRSTYRQSKALKERADKSGSKENLCEARRQSLEFDKERLELRGDGEGTLVAKSVTAQSAVANRLRVTGEGRPVAAPRSVVPAPDEDAPLRHKPAVPERPPALRPHSLRASDAAPPTLERTHLYSVDKHQPTVIQVLYVYLINNYLQITHKFMQFKPRNFFMSVTSQTYLRSKTLDYYN